MKLDLRTILTVGGIVVALAGFYHTTNLRLDNLEKKVTSLEQANARLLKTVNRKLKRLGR